MELLGAFGDMRSGGELAQRASSCTVSLKCKSGRVLRLSRSSRAEAGELPCNIRYTIIYDL